MKFDRTGFILYTINYPECVQFYREILELKVMFETDSLTCFEFGGSYLMVEIDDSPEAASPDALRQARIRTCLRLNVPEVKTIADMLHRKGLEVDYQEHSWGNIAKFFDPDGNLIGIKDSPGFEEQIQGNQS